MTGPRRADRLHNLLAVTDTALSRLDVEDLLDEILERVRAILDADTAAVLLRADGADHLVARAAVGLEQEVREGVHVPIGVGFAGAIAASKRPVVLDRVDENTVSNPILWEKGIRAMLGVPLLADDTVIGVLHVGRLIDRGFTRDDIELLQVAAERVASAVQIRRLAVETAAARQLERGLILPRLPSVPGLRLAARYVPAGNQLIGGDWYDTFRLPSGELWLVTGDVAGHGLRAAIVMARVKSALRAYALLGEPPERVLELTDRKVRHFEMGTMVTIVCAVAPPPYDRLTICSAGHLPPVRAVPGADAELLTVPTGPPLNVVPEVRRESIDVEFPLNAVLLLYTDGLVERRDATLQAGLDRLREAVSAQHPEGVCRTVMHQLVGIDVPTDDIAVLAARRVPPSPE